MQSPAELLGPHGPLARHVSGFLPRIAQQEMAEAVANTLEEAEVLIAEAGTGTGKTFAYLVPAILSGRKIIISTGTKNLQDQLFHRDLPTVRKALGMPVSLALLKGRANYLCQHRLAMAEDEARFQQRGEVEKLIRIRTWAGQTHSGDIAELPVVGEDDSIWPRVTSTTDNCLGQECSAFAECFLMQARRQAQAADIVVINHHLLFADMNLREEGFAELLPAADAFIIDEAHQLPDTASSFFGLSVSGNQLIGLARDTASEYRQEINETNDIYVETDHLEKAVRDFRLALGKPQRRAAWSELARQKGLVDAINTVTEALQSLQQWLDLLAERSKGLESCQRRCSQLTERFTLLTQQAPVDHIHWFETHRRSFTLHLTPLSIADYFQRHMQTTSGAWIFTSATLAVGENFSHFSNRLGLLDADTARWDSPFDYRHQALLYVPPDLPEPNNPGYTAAVIEAARPVLNTSGGRAFLLFTSHRALNEAAQMLEEAFDYPLLVQGEAPRDRLLEQFRALGNAVLLGTSSFWEGVDVRGEALSCVIIDKLPFASPGDPVLQARIDAMREQGRNPFMEYQLPNAVITLKQGVGRLIRDVTDRGLLMICDPRLTGKPYGRIFLNSLPPMPRTTKLEVVRRFYALANNQAESASS